MRVTVVGAGSVGASIVRELCGHGHDVVVIDEKPEAIGRSDLHNSHWIVGDACDPAILREAQLEQADVMVAATGDDKVNLVVSLMARSEFGVPRTVGRVNNPKNEWMFDQAWGVDVAVSTPRLITALVEEAVEVGDVVRLLNLQSDRATLNAYTVPHGHRVIASTVGDVPWPPDATLVAILRDGTPLAPTRDDVIESEDELFFLATGHGESQLQELFAR
ncbi:potassium channel family protein [Kocuria sp.]|uniref:potassium channel family protein n=1 Tax=Kocuria sp. TaxID=1871328 RepID=UPI0026DF1212|nr:TrkA family potassium uptake protein [Kocuria sp.]MDO5619359.1 TrkA family potassium uptake protein [Kocuria sp.]